MLKVEFGEVRHRDSAWPLDKKGTPTKAARFKPRHLGSRLRNAWLAREVLADFVMSLLPGAGFNNCLIWFSLALEKTTYTRIRKQLRGVAAG